MPHQPAQVLLEYESAATQRRDKLWRLALTTTKVHIGFLALALLLSAFSIPRNVAEVQWENLNAPQRFVVWMGYVGVLHAMATLTSVVALVALRRIVHRRSGWPMLLLYLVPQLALLAAHEGGVLLVGEGTITLSKTAGSASLFIVNGVYLRLAYYAMLSVPLLMIAYNLIDHLANRRPATRHPDARSSA